MRRLALLLLGATLLALFLPYFARDQVVHPPDDSVGLADASCFYVPTLQQHLRGNGTRWISTWDPHTQLGRPTFQLYGLGKAFLLTHVLAWFSDDALRVYTWSALAAVALTCLFGFLLLDALGLHPLASAAGALGLGVGCLAFYPLCFTLFLWNLCWETALFWCVTLFLRRPTPARGLGIAFFVHALLLTGYPQTIVWTTYGLAGYVVLRLVRIRAGPGPAAALGAKLAACVLAGVASVAPVYLDLLENARLSTRLAFDPEFFAATMPDLGSLSELGAFVARVLDAFCFGNPVEAYSARSYAFLLPLWAALAAASVGLADLRRLWPLHAFLLVALAMTVWKDFYLVVLRVLGLGLSRSIPLRQGYLALMVLGALAADRAMRGTLRSRRAVLCIAGACVAAAAAAWASDVPVARGESVLALGFALGSAIFVLTRSGWCLAALAVASALVYGRRLEVARDHDDVLRATQLIETVRKETADGSRFAWVGDTEDALAPNKEALYDVRSIHGYDPLASRRFKRWAARYREEPPAGRDRRFLFVTDLVRFTEESAALSATKLLLSKRDLSAPGAPALVPERIAIVRSRVGPVLELQTEDWLRTDPEEVRIEVAGEVRAGLAVERTAGADDHLEFQTTPSERETLLLVSQQHHPGWRARAGERELATVVVNDLFLGVVLPPGTRAVALDFRAWTRWSWVAQALFAAAAVLVGARKLR